MTVRHGMTAFAAAALATSALCAPVAAQAAAASSHAAKKPVTAKQEAAAKKKAAAKHRKAAKKPVASHTPVLACKSEKPAKVSFGRHVGQTVGQLKWAIPAKAAGLHGSRAVRYRVTRDGAVLGQTAKRSMKVSVALDHTYKFAVTALNAKGKATHCSTTFSRRVVAKGPGVPQFVAVTGNEAGLHLRWQPGSTGDSPITGYRVLRDGKLLGQSAGTSRDVAAAPNQSYSFAVETVDKHGRVSAATKAVTANTTHTAPTAPGAVTATAVSDQVLGISWQPSQVEAGRIVAYRVIRNGAVVEQVPGTADSATISNLAPSTSYDVSVVAIDSYGYMSAASSAAARTQDPAPTSGSAQAYLLSSTDESFEDFMAHYQEIGVVYPTYYGCTNSAGFKGQDDPLMTQWAEARRVRVMPRFNCQAPAVIHRILTDATTRQTWIDHIMALVDQYGYAGATIDFETDAGADRAVFSSFIADLASRLHADGRLLSVAASAKVRDIPDHPRSGIFDYPVISQSADWVIVMAWGLHWATSAPGAQDDATWVRQVADYIATMPLKNKFILGTNLYAMDWPNGGGTANPATAYQYGDIVPRLPSLGATIAYDPTSDNEHATYTDSSGVKHDVWYPDASTTGNRIQLARNEGLGGVAFWRLGAEDQRTWSDPLLAPGTTW